MYPASNDSIVESIRSELGYYVSPSTVQKDIYFLRHDSTFGLFVPIKSNKHGYYLDCDYSLSCNIKKTWGV